MTPRDDDRYWRRTYTRTLLAAVVAIVGILGVQGLLDRLEQDTEARLAFLRAVDEKCIPLQDGQSAIAVRHRSIVRCHVYTNNSPGLARQLISSAVMDVPQ